MNVYNREIMLEPRLQEYIKKKNFYRQSNIMPVIEPEKEFQITAFDMEIIKKHMQGTRNVHASNPLESSAKYSQILKTETRFPSSYFQDDTRVPDIEKHNQQLKQPANMGMFVPDGSNQNQYYEIKQNPMPLPYYNFDQSNMYFQSELTHGGRTQSDDDFFKQCKLLDDDQIKEQKQQLKRKQNNTVHQYEFESQFGPAGPENVDLETELVRGMPHYPRNRSMGYKQPTENYFDYLNCPGVANMPPQIINSIEPWNRGGDSTRLNNKKTMYERDIF